MTVKELREALEGLDPDMPVRAYTCDEYGDNLRDFETRAALSHHDAHHTEEYGGNASGTFLIFFGDEPHE